MADQYFGSNAGKVTIKGGRASRSQRQILGRALAYANKVNAPYAAKKALIAALIVESEAKNLSTPSADGYGSYGVLQGREIYHSRKNLMNPEYQFAVFLGKSKKWPKGFTSKGNAIELAKKGMKSGDIAQMVEGSAYPERYGQVGKEAAKIIRLFEGGSAGSGKVDALTGGKAAPAASATNATSNLAALLSYAQNRNRSDSTELLANVAATPVDTPSTVTPTSVPKVPKTGGTVAPSGSGGGGGSKLKEFFYTPVGQWKGTTPIGVVPNHSNHVHIAAGVKTTVKLGKLAQKMGLRVGENKAFSGSTPTGGHAPNSWHYKDRAIDVSGDPAKMKAFALRVKRMYGLK